eukprot:gene4355-biopygen5415
MRLCATRRTEGPTRGRRSHHQREKRRRPRPTRASSVPVYFSHHIKRKRGC